MFDLTVKTLDSRNHSFSLEDDITVRTFKEKIAEDVGVPADSQRLIYCGRVLQDEKKLIEYDVHGKVIHLVQRAPPQSGQRGNSGGQGQGQDQGQGQGRHTHRPHFRHARAQVRLPRIDGNAMYLGAMSFPADAEGQGIPNPQLCSRQSHVRLAVVEEMLTKVNRSLHILENPTDANNSADNNSSSATSQEPTSQDPEQQEQGNHEQQDNEQENEQDETNSFEISVGGGGASLAQATSAAINAALSAAGLNNVAGLSTAALSSLTLLGAQTDGGSPSIIHAHIQRNNTEDVDHTGASAQNSDDIGESEQAQTTQEQQPSQSENPEGSQQQQNASANGNRSSSRRHAPLTPNTNTARMGRLIGYLMHTQDRLRPYLERYQGIIMPDRVWPTGGGPDSAEEAQRIVDGVSESLHYLSHASHTLSDIIIDMNQQPPRNLLCRPHIVQHSALLQAGIPIQVEAHISLHGRNQNVNNNNESGNTTAPATGAAPGAQESAENSTPTSEANPQQQQQQQSESGGQQQQQQSQQQTFGTLFNVPHNVEVLMEVGPEISGNDQNQQNSGNRNNNNNGNTGGISAGIFPWGASPPPDLMRSLMQMVAGQMARGVATATTQNPNQTPNSNASGTGEQQQQATTTDGASATTAANVEGSNSSNPGQSTQARGNTGTHPTTSTQTRSTPRPHVFHSNANPLGLGLGFIFDPFLSCNSHHIRRNSNANSNANNNPTSQQQQASQSSTTSGQNQTATSATPVNSGNPPARESNASTGNSTPAPPPQAANNLPIVNLLTQILSGVGAQGGQIQTVPGGWMQLISGGIPIVQNLMANSSNNQSGGGMTLMDLLENTPGLGVSTNIGIIGPLRMDQTAPGEDLLFDLVVAVVQNITLRGWEELRTGHWEPLTGIRRPLREFFQNFFNSPSLSGSEDRVIDRLITELQPTLNQLLLEDTNAREGPEMNVDIPATIERLLRRHFLNILRLLFDNDVDDTRFAQGLLASIKTLQTEACSALQYSFRGRQIRIETVAQRIVTRLTEGVEPGIRQWIINSCVSHVCSYLVNMTQLPDNEVVPLLVFKTNSTPTPPAPIVQQTTVQQTQQEPEPMETDVVEERGELETLDGEGGATFPGHEAVPPDWVPIIARDGVRQRRQLQVQMQSQGMAASGVVGGFSDAYLGGMPSKRRKLIEQQKPRILLSPTTNHSSVSISMERLVRDSVGRAGIEEIEGAANAVATDVGVRRAFGDAIRGCLYQHPQRQTSPDFPDPTRFPNATKYFAKKNDTDNNKK